MAERRSSRLGLYLPFALLGFVAVLWTVWWFVVAGQAQARIDSAAVQMRRAGYQVGWSGREVTGWPFRTYVRFRDLRVAAPSGHALAAPRFGAQAHTYALGKWVLAAPDGLTVTRGAKGEVRIDARAIRASVAGLERSPPRLVVELLDARFAAAPGAEPFPLATAKSVDFHLRPKADAAGQGEFLFRVIDGRGREAGVLDWVAGGGPFTSQWEGTVAAADAFAGPSWATAVRGWSARGGAITGLRGRFQAGDAVSEAQAARLTVGPDGRLRGAADLVLTGGPAPLIAMGRVQGGNAAGAAAAGAAAAAQNALGGTARVRLAFEGGRTRVGPLNLAPAPKVY
ncbi:MAG TPA: DUF2125 domain-containing protein [Caulobacteraceae bacterium]|nr:DUF2125 domain-containing protein [Caulobacteraceae bacterium]